MAMRDLGERDVVAERREGPAPTEAASGEASATGVVLTSDRALAEIVLDRPASLNVVTPEMVAAIPPALARWAGDPAIYALAIHARPGRAFCAGGDLRRMLADVAEGGDVAAGVAAREYALNYALHAYTKPSVSFVDGLCFGSGVGLSIYATHRLAGPAYRFAMPEVKVGFFPDVGATWFLGRLPGEMGTYLALSGRAIGREDALALGLVTHCVSAEAFAQIRAGLADAEPIDPLIDARHVDPGVGELADRRAVIDRHFAHDSVGEIVAALERERGGQADWCRELALEILSHAPMSLAVALAQMRYARKGDLRAALGLEYRLACHMLTRPDLAEGVRALLIDKDRAPRWSPANSKDVPAHEVAALFDDAHPVRPGFELPPVPPIPLIAER